MNMACTPCLSLNEIHTFTEEVKGDKTVITYTCKEGHTKQMEMLTDLWKLVKDFWGW